MDDGEVLLGRRWNDDLWDSLGGRRKCGKKRERQTAHSVSKLTTMGPIPGIDGVECLQVPDAGTFHDTHQVQAGIGNCAGAVCKADQGKHRARGPYFGVHGAGGFHGRKRKNDVADSARTDQKTFLNG
jgi:hypothetical protein